MDKEVLICAAGLSVCVCERGSEPSGVKVNVSLFTTVTHAPLYKANSTYLLPVCKKIIKGHTLLLLHTGCLRNFAGLGVSLL